MSGLANKVAARGLALVLVMLIGLSVVWSDGTAAKAASVDEASNAANSYGTVYSLTNDATGNAVAVYERASDGKLTRTAFVFTGGNGTGSSLGSQGALALSGNLVFAVNAGSDSISVLRIEPYGLRLLDTIPSGGLTPVSLTVHNNVVYVLNAGGEGNITGFRFNGAGKLSLIANSGRPLSGNNFPGAVDVAFSPNGKLLVVTEKLVNKIDTYQVAANGLATLPKTFDSAGQTPFGFTFDGNNHLIVSEAFGGAANASATSSYQVSSEGVLEVISKSVLTHQTAACWAIVSKDGKYVWTGDPNSDTLTGYAVGNTGTLTLLNSDGRTGTTTTGANPEDEAISRDGRFLYVLDTKAGKISAFKVETNGQLTALADFGGLPLSSAGLAAR